MFQSVHIENFRCLRHVTVALDPFTVLVGKNDTGKSSFLGTIQFMAAAGVHGFHLSHAAEVVTLGKLPQSLNIELSHKKGLIRLPEERGGKRPNGALVGPTSYLQNVQSPYRFAPEVLRRQAQVGILERNPLPPDGMHLAAAVDRLPTSRFIRLQKDFAERLPLVKEIRRDPVSHGHKGLFFDVHGAGILPASAMSDGVMLVLAYLTVVYEEFAPALIMIEEPENGIHPKQLEHVVRLLHSLTTRENPTQVIMTTHSPYVLDFVPKGCVRVFSRNEQGDVKVENFDKLDEIQDMLSKGFTLGEAWYNTDEEKLISEQHANPASQ